MDGPNCNQAHLSAQGLDRNQAHLPVSPSIPSAAPSTSRNSSDSNTAMAAAAADDDVKLESFLQWLQVAPSPIPISRPISPLKP